MTFRREGNQRIATAVEPIAEFEEMFGVITAIDDANRQLTIGEALMLRVPDYLDLSEYDIGQRVRVVLERGASDNIAVELGIE